MKKLLLIFGFGFLLFASFAYGVFSAKHANLPFKMVRYLYQQQKKLFSDSEPIRQGYWHVARNTMRNHGLSAEQRESLANMSALPYLKGYNKAPDVTNITYYKEEKAYNGLNLVVSAHGPEAILTDMQSNVLHVWHKEFDQVWSESRDLDRNQLYKTFWRRVYAFNNGDLLAIFRDYGLIKLDKNSNLLWAYQGRCHHDLFVTDAGNIYVLSRVRRKNPRLKLASWGARNSYLEDLIVILNSQGVEQKRVSVVDCFLNSEYAPMLEHMKDRENILHANSIEILDGTLADKFPMFKKGHILISLREIHTIAVIDLENEKVAWALTGKWKYQHEPSLMRNGNILLFDNRGGENGKSKIVEINPLTQEVVWTYQGTPEKEFFSMTAGTTQRLANGNTLITESNNGRAFEVTPQGEIVWEFINPHRAGEKNELIAALYDVVRLERNRFDWLTISSKAN